MSTGQAAREPAIDALRGIALFGILAVNLPFFAMPEGLIGTWWRTAFPSWYDGLAIATIHTLFDGKFILIFSLLFGIGAARQIGQSGAAAFRRRLLALALFGALHALLLFAGDILFTYAIVGLLLPIAARWPMQRLLRSAVAFFVLSIIGHTLIAAGLTAVRLPAADGAALVQLHQTGGFLAIAQQRISDIGLLIALTPLMFMPQVASFFLIGMAAERWLAGRPLAGIRAQLAAVARFLWRPALAGNIAYGATALVAAWTSNDGLTAVSVVLRAVFPPVLALVLICFALYAFTTPTGARLSRLFATDGRLSLSLYVGESLICNFVFYSFGLGLYSKVGPAAGLGLTLAIYAALLGFGALWTRLFQIGPLEWLMTQIIGRRSAPTAPAR